MIHDGFPPHVVANRANHTPAMEGDAYLPPDEGLDSGEFGKLDVFGNRVTRPPNVPRKCAIGCDGVLHGISC